MYIYILPSNKFWQCCTFVTCTLPSDRKTEKYDESKIEISFDREFVIIMRKIKPLREITFVNKNTASTCNNGLYAD